MQDPVSVVGNTLAGHAAPATVLGVHVLVLVAVPVCEEQDTLQVPKADQPPHWQLKGVGSTQLSYKNNQKLKVECIIKS